MHGWGGMHGLQGASVVAGGGHVCVCRGACMVVGGAWLWGSCMVAGVCVWLLGGMHGCGGHAWLLGGVHGCRGAWLLGGCIGYNEIRSMDGRYASYWNACLLLSSFRSYSFVQICHANFLVLLLIVFSAGYSDEDSGQMGWKLRDNAG